MKEYRICEVCGIKNEVFALECSCGADLSFVPPSMDENQATVKTEPCGSKTQILAALKLISSKDGYMLEIPTEGGLLGREGTINKEYFVDNLWVSNHHARIYLQGMTYVIRDEKSTNGTKLNGNMLEKGKEYPLQNGDKIILANMEFLLNVQ